MIVLAIGDRFTYYYIQPITSWYLWVCHYCRSFVCGAIWWVVKLGLFICTSISYECSSLISWFNRQSIKLFNGLLGLFKISQHYNRWTSYYCTYISMWCYFMMHNKYLCVAILYSRIFSFHEIHTFIGP